MGNQKNLMKNHTNQLDINVLKKVQVNASNLKVPVRNSRWRFSQLLCATHFILDFTFIFIFLIHL